MKKYFLSLCAMAMIMVGTLSTAQAAQKISKIAPEDQTQVHVFVRDDCKHCQEEEKFLDDLQKEDASITVTYYNLAEKENSELFEKVTEKYSLVKGTPVTLVHDKLFQGFDAKETTGKLIKDILSQEKRVQPAFADIVQGEEKTAIVLSSIGSSQSVCGETLADDCSIGTDSFVVSVPFTERQIDVGSLSLVSLSLVLGLIDGFNPCAMWVLVMFLMILSQAGSRRRMVQFAGLFIVAEAVMYYAILGVWMTTWNFVTLDAIVTPMVGFLAVGSGIYFLYKFATWTAVCSVADAQQQAKIGQRISEMAKKSWSWGVLFGILGIAFSVNIFEFACSIGIPQTFTKILELNELGLWGSQFYMFLYILMYMLDDVLVFALAIWGMNKLGVTQKYSKWTTFAGGVLMVILGIIMLLRPDLLVI